MFKAAVKNPRDQALEAFRLQNLQELDRLLTNGVSPNLYILPKRVLTMVGCAQLLKNDALLSLLVSHGGRMQDVSGQASLSEFEMQIVLNEEKRQQSAVCSMDILDTMPPVAKKNKLADSAITEVSKIDQFKKAVLNGDLQRLRTLMTEVNNHICYVNAENDTPLHYACRSGNEEMVELLMTSPRMHLHLLNKAGFSPLSLAIDSENKRILKHLSKHPDFQKHVTAYFNDAVAKLKHKAVVFLAEQYPFLAFDKIAWAMQTNDLHFFTQQLKAGNKPTVLHFKQAVNHLDERFLTQLMHKDHVSDLMDSLAKHENLLLILAANKKWKLVQDFIHNRPTNILDPYGYTDLLMAALGERNEVMVAALLAEKTPLHCLYGDSGIKLLNTLREEGKDEIIRHLIKAASHDEEIAKFIKFHAASIPEELVDYFTDSINPVQISEPVITPQGTTYQKQSILDCIDRNNLDPITRQPLTEDALLPNHDVKALMEYYLVNGDLNAKRIPLLTSAATGLFYQDPVVAEDGYTYERSELQAYLRKHRNELPRRSPMAPVVVQERELYRNLLFKQITEEVYLKREFTALINARNFTALNKWITAGFSRDTLLDNNNNRAIHLAIAQNDTELFELCVKHGANFHAPNKQKKTAAQLAATSENHEFFYLILSKSTPDELQKLFITHAVQNDVLTVRLLLASFPDKLEDVVFSVVATLIEKKVQDTFGVILEHLQNVNQLDFIDALLPGLIATRNLAAIKIILATKVPMRSLMSIAATTQLQTLNSPENADLKEFLLAASKMRHPAVTFRINKLLNPAIAENESDFPDEIDDLLCDPINFSHFENPQVAPEGQTFSYKQIIGQSENPLTRQPLAAKDLRPNLLLADLIEFLQQNPDKAPPMLISLLSSKPLKNPVIGENGITYDEDELHEYRQTHQGKLPDQMTTPCYPDLTMRSCCEYYKKNGFFAEKSPENENGMVAEHGQSAQCK